MLCCMMGPGGGGGEIMMVCSSNLCEDKPMDNHQCMLCGEPITEVVNVLNDTQGGPNILLIRTMSFAIVALRGRMWSLRRGRPEAAPMLPEPARWASWSRHVRRREAAPRPPGRLAEAAR